MGMIRYQRHQMLNTAIVAISIGFVATFTLQYFILYEIKVRLMERGIFERDNKETLFTSLWKGHRERLISSYLALFLAYINHFACISFYSFLLLLNKMGFKEKAFFDGFIVNTKVYMTTKNMVSIVLYPLVTLAPFLISAPYLMRIYRKLRVESEENLIRAYGIK